MEERSRRTGVGVNLRVGVRVGVDLRVCVGLGDRRGAVWGPTTCTELFAISRRTFHVLQAAHRHKHYL